MRNGIARPARDVANPDWRTSALQGRTRRVPSRFACTRNSFPGRAAGRGRGCIAAGPADHPRGRATCPPGQPPLSDCLISAEHGGTDPDLSPGQMTPTTASFAQQARHFWHVRVARSKTCTAFPTKASPRKLRAGARCRVWSTSTHRPTPSPQRTRCPPAAPAMATCSDHRTHCKCLLGCNRRQKSPMNGWVVEITCATRRMSERLSRCMPFSKPSGLIHSFDAIS